LTSVKDVWWGRGYVVFCVLVELGDYPGWGIGNTEIEDLACLDERVECMGEFFD
jgi:hypothetical protein